MLRAAFGAAIIFIIIMISLWVLLAMWIARRTNTPLWFVIVSVFVPYANYVVCPVLLICAILNYNVGQHINLSNSGYFSNSNMQQFQQIPTMFPTNTMPGFQQPPMPPKSMPPKSMPPKSMPPKSMPPKSMPPMPPKSMPPKSMPPKSMPGFQPPMPGFQPPMAVAVSA